MPGLPLRSHPCKGTPPHIPAQQPIKTPPAPPPAQDAKPHSSPGTANMREAEPPAPGTKLKSSESTRGRTGWTVHFTTSTPERSTPQPLRSPQLGSEPLMQAYHCNRTPRRKVTTTARSRRRGGHKTANHDHNNPRDPLSDGRTLRKSSTEAQTAAAASRQTPVPTPWYHQVRDGRTFGPKPW